MSAPALELRAVSKRYGRVEALREVALEVQPGQVVGLLGPNGAGKTTAVKCLAGLVLPSAGQALIAGEPAQRPASRVGLGFVPERPELPRWMSAAELLDREGRMFGLPRPVRRERTARLLDRVGLPGSLWTRRVGTWSKGEQARLLLALALVGDPRALLLDEPTDGLDPLGRRAVKDILGQLRAEGRAVLLNSHLLGEVEEVCDQVVVLRAGQVVGRGAPAELQAAHRPVYEVRLGAPLDEAALAALRERWSDARAQGAALELSLTGPEETDALVDWLRGRGSSLRELRPRHSLEEAVLQLVRPTGGVR